MTTYESSAFKVIEVVEEVAVSYRQDRIPVFTTQGATVFVGILLARALTAIALAILALKEEKPS